MATELKRLVANTPAEHELLSDLSARHSVKWIHCTAFEELLHVELVWRDKEQVYGGSRSLDVPPALARSPHWRVQSRVMASDHDLGTFAGVQLRVDNNAMVASLLLWAMVHTILWWVLELPPLAALQASLALLALHWFSILVHHFGHALAAHSTGYPMEALILSGLLGRDRYPQDEPELPLRAHATRALGGPAASLIAGLGLAVGTLILQPAALTTQLVLWSITLENLILLGVGVFVPLGFTDGSTLINLWRWGHPQGPPS